MALLRCKIEKSVAQNRILKISLHSNLITMKKFIVLYVAFIVALVISSCTGTKDEQARKTADSLRRVDSLVKIDSARKAAELLIPKDTALDNTARFIAGLPQLSSNALAS